MYLIVEIAIFVMAGT